MLFHLILFLITFLNVWKGYFHYVKGDELSPERLPDLPIVTQLVSDNLLVSDNY